MDNQQVDLIAHTKAQVNDKKDEINVYYAEYKIKLPTYLKTLTLKELKEAGGAYYPNIFVPKNLEDRLKSTADSSRKQKNIEEKLASLFEQKKNQIISNYRKLREDLPQELLQAKLGDIENKLVITNLISTTLR